MEKAVSRAAEDQTMILTARESEEFADAILRPAEPGPVLRKAACDYLRKTDSR